jgi:HSP90 family molecular chaperone
VEGRRYLRFIISNSAFIVESNEAGFTRANVEAICATGKSSKKATAADDQIGEKGLGFKSVFSVAKEVHVQSGVWSFRFQHNPKDDGLGMVTPLHALQEVLPSGVGTRITLQLIDQSAPAYQKLLEAVSEIPKTSIMYLQRLQQIEISIKRTDGRTEKINITKTASLLSHSTRITRSRTLDLVKEQDVSTFLRFTRGPITMPEDNRRKNGKEVEVAVAFPIDSISMKPKISGNGQYLFAYLPVQRLSQLPVSGSEIGKCESC